MISIESLLKRARSTGYGAKLCSASMDETLHAVLVGEVPCGSDEQEMVQRCILRDVNPSVVLHEFFDPKHPSRTENHRVSYDRIRKLELECDEIIEPLDMPHLDLLGFQRGLFEIYSEHFKESSGKILEEKAIEDSVNIRRRWMSQKIIRSIKEKKIPVVAILSSSHLEPQSKIYDELEYHQSKSPFNFVVINQDAELQRRLNTYPAFFQ